MPPPCKSTNQHPLNGITATTTPVAWVQNNNNLPLAATIVVGDQPANGTLTNVGTLQITATGKGGVSGFALAANQVLAGFGNVTGSSTYGINLGQAPSGATAGAIVAYPTNPNPATPTALTGTNSVVSPGYTSSGTALVLLNNQSQYQPNNAMYGSIVLGASGNGTSTVAFNTKLGNAASLSAPTATGALTLGNGANMTTTIGGAGTYYWKLDLASGGAGQTSNPGTAQVAPSSNNFSGTAPTGNPPVAGTAWDELILDTVAVNSTIGSPSTVFGSGTTNAFTIQATSFNSGAAVPNGSAVLGSGGSPVTSSSGTMGTTTYSWVIARVNVAYNATQAQGLLASLSLDTSGLPAPNSSYEYFLSAQADPSASDTDLVVNYAPAPEPGGLALLGLGASALAFRRRRDWP